ncbi:MAG: response regulator [Bernardetiaceae bacterium]
MKKHQVFLTDDHQLILDGLQMIFAQTDDFEVIATAHSGWEALQKVPILCPDLVVMDIDMPGLNGLETTRRLKAQLPAIKITLLTMHLEPSLIDKLQQVGADGYMVKDGSQAELLKGLRLVMSGETYYSPLIKRTDTPPDTHSTISLHLTLSERELEVLRLLVDGLSSKEIADRLCIGTETVHTYRKNLLRKLHARNVAHLVKIALQSGMVL